MEIDTNLKKIIKHYLKAKDYENDENKWLLHLEKIVVLLEKINKNNIEKMIDPSYIENIKNYAYSNITKIITESLTKNNKAVSSDIFNIVAEGNVNSITDTENIYNYDIFNEEGLTPLHKCINLGDTTILREFFKKGEKVDIVNKDGHTLLEFACLQKDPNLIQFILNHGASMKKHLYFRNNYKVHLSLNDIDTAIIIKISMLAKDNNITNCIDFLYKYIKPDTKIGIDDIRFKDFIKSLEALLNILGPEIKETIIKIWKEELYYNLNNKLGCPGNYLELILINLVPFINYPFNITNRNVLTNELIFTTKKMFKDNHYILDVSFNKKLINNIWNNYENEIPYDYIGVVISHIFSKIRRKV
jgi:ankyrin repeat protein